LLVAEANQKFESNSQPDVSRAFAVIGLLVAEANQKFESNSQLYYAPHHPHFQVVGSRS